MIGPSGRFSEFQKYPWACFGGLSESNADRSRRKLRLREQLVEQSKCSRTRSRTFDCAILRSALATGTTPDQSLSEKRGLSRQRYHRRAMSLLCLHRVEQEPS